MAKSVVLRVPVNAVPLFADEVPRDVSGGSYSVVHVGLRYLSFQCVSGKRRTLECYLFESRPHIIRPSNPAEHVLLQLRGLQAQRVEF